MAKHPQQITTADTALDDDMKSRIIKYSITMGIRTLCFVAAYFLFVEDLVIPMWICVAGAVLLPYPAVIIANAGRELTRNDESALLDEAPMAELPPSAGDTISGETIPGEPDDAAPDATEGPAADTDADTGTGPDTNTDGTTGQFRDEDS